MTPPHWLSLPEAQNHGPACLTLATFFISVQLLRRGCREADPVPGDRQTAFRDDSRIVFLREIEWPEAYGEQNHPRRTAA